MLTEVKDGFMVLQIVAEIHNDVRMTSQIVHFRFISLFGNHFIKIKNTKNLMRTSLSRKMVQNIIKTVILAVWSFLLLFPWQQCKSLKFAISYESKILRTTNRIHCF